MEEEVVEAIIVDGDTGIIDSEAVIVEKKDTPKKRNYPTKHNKNSMTEKQEIFAENLAAGKTATDAVIVAYGDEVRYPSQFGHALRNKPQIQRYLMDTAQECAEIQMKMIIDKKTPAAVRNDAIKDRLNRAGVKADEEPKDDVNLSIGNIIINVVN